MWQGMGKTLIVVGVVLAAVGALLVLGGRIPFLGRLPGDIEIRRGGSSLYLPITTCVLVSVVLTLVLWLVSKLKG